MTTRTLAPVIRSVTVNVPQQRAFAFSASSTGSASATIEPHEGGRWFEAGAEGDGATRVGIEHRNIEQFGHESAAVRSSLDGGNGWSAVLRAFAEGPLAGSAP